MSELRLEFQKEMVCLSNSGYALTKFTQNNTLLHGAVIEACSTNAIISAVPSVQAHLLY